MLGGGTSNAAAEGLCWEAMQATLHEREGEAWERGLRWVEREKREGEMRWREVSDEL